MKTRSSARIRQQSSNSSASSASASVPSPPATEPKVKAKAKAALPSKARKNAVNTQEASVSSPAIAPATAPSHTLTTAPTSTPNPGPPSKIDFVSSLLDISLCTPSLVLQLKLHMGTVPVLKCFNSIISTLLASSPEVQPDVSPNPNLSSVAEAGSLLLSAARSQALAPALNLTKAAVKFSQQLLRLDLRVQALSAALECWSHLTGLSAAEGRLLSIPSDIVKGEDANLLLCFSAIQALSLKCTLSPFSEDLDLVLALVALDPGKMHNHALTFHKQLSASSDLRLQLFAVCFLRFIKPDAVCHHAHSVAYHWNAANPRNEASVCAHLAMLAERVWPQGQEIGAASLQGWLELSEFWIKIAFKMSSSSSELAYISTLSGRILSQSSSTGLESALSNLEVGAGENRDPSDLPSQLLVRINNLGSQLSLIRRAKTVDANHNLDFTPLLSDLKHIKQLDSNATRSFSLLCRAVCDVCSSPNDWPDRAEVVPDFARQLLGLPLLKTNPTWHIQLQIALARHSLSRTKPTANSDAALLLRSAMSTIKDTLIDSSAESEFLRTISAVAYNVGGELAHNSFHLQSVEMLTISCDCCDILLQNETSESTNIRASAVKRYELLGHSLGRMSRNQESLVYLQKAVQLSVDSELATLRLFQDKSTEFVMNHKLLTKLMTLIKRWLYLRVFDLLLPPVLVGSEPAVSALLGRCCIVLIQTRNSQQSGNLIQSMLDLLLELPLSGIAETRVCMITLQHMIDHQSSSHHSTWRVRPQELTEESFLRPCVDILDALCQLSIAFHASADREILFDKAQKLSEPIRILQLRVSTNVPKGEQEMPIITHHFSEANVHSATAAPPAPSTPTRAAVTLNSEPAKQTSDIESYWDDIVALWPFMNMFLDLITLLQFDSIGQDVSDSFLAIIKIMPKSHLTTASARLWSSCLTMKLEHRDLIAFEQAIGSSVQSAFMRKEQSFDWSILQIDILLCQSYYYGLQSDKEHSTEHVTRAWLLQSQLRGEKLARGTEGILQECQLLSRSAKALFLISRLSSSSSISLRCLHQSLRLWFKAIASLARIKIRQPPKSAPQNPFLEFPSASVTPDDAKGPQTLNRPKFDHETISIDLSTHLSQIGMVSSALLTIQDITTEYEIRGLQRETEFFWKQMSDLAATSGAVSWQVLGALGSSQAKARAGLIQCALDKLKDLSSINLFCFEQESYNNTLAFLSAANTRFHLGDSHIGRQIDDLKLITSSPREKKLHLHRLSYQFVQSVRLKIMSPGSSVVIVSPQDHSGLGVYKDLLDATNNFALATEMFKSDFLLSSIEETVMPLSLHMNLVADSERAVAAVTLLDKCWQKTDLTSLHRNRYIYMEDKRILTSRAILSLSIASCLGHHITSNRSQFASSLDQLTGDNWQMEIQDMNAEMNLSMEQSWPKLLVLEEQRTAASKLALKKSLTTLTEANLSRMNLNDDPSQNFRQRGSTINLEVASRLPDEWHAISIRMSDDFQSIILKKDTSFSNEPVVLYLPLNRSFRREEDCRVDDELTYASAISQFNSIIKESDDSILSVKDIKLSHDKAKWWDTRGALDDRLKTLLSKLQTCWLGYYKIFFEHGHPPAASVLERFGQDISNFTSKYVSASRKGVKGCSFSLNLPKDLLQTIYPTPAALEEEDFEDLLYFLLELASLQSSDFSMSDVDLDQAMQDLKLIFEMGGYHTRKPYESEHTFLVLDKYLQRLPWESMPCLRGRSISRVPNVQFVHDKMKEQRTTSRSSVNGRTMGDACVDDCTKLSLDKTYFLLNPSQDLTGTEHHFTPWIQEMNLENPDWYGTIGKPPKVNELRQALETCNLVIYFGHGGAQKYIKSQEIRKLTCCAAVMLWGCSSAFLFQAGEFEQFGTAWDYLVGGCRSLIGNMWDVTDKDIDRLSKSVFQKMGAIPKTGRSATGRAGIQSNTKAVAQSRDVCRLTYLTGAATICYGLPLAVSSIHA